MLIFLDLCFGFCFIFKVVLQIGFFQTKCEVIYGWYVFEIAQRNNCTAINDASVMILIVLASFLWIRPWTWTMALPLCTFTVFELFLNWCYHKNILSAATALFFLSPGPDWQSTISCRRIPLNTTKWDRRRKMDNPPSFTFTSLLWDWTVSTKLRW